jgi:hypothetical protein
MRLSAALFLLAAAVYGQAAPDADELLRKTGERFYGLANFDVGMRVANLGDRPNERKFRIALREDDSLLYDPGTGSQWIVRDARLIRIHDGNKEWTETAAEGPALRSLQRWIEPYVTRFEKLAGASFETEFVKWQELKRGAKKVRCAMIRLRPKTPAEGLWKETLWIEPESALIWRSLWVEPMLGGGTTALETIRKVDYDWRVVDAPPADGLFQPEKLKKYKKVDAITFRPMGGLPSPVM